MQRYPVAAAVSVAAVLHGPRRLAVVAAVTDQAVYVDTGDRDRPAVCLVTPGAVRVPCALVLGGRAALPRLALGDTGLIGGGELALAGVAYRPARWWRPARPRTAAVAAPLAVGPLADPPAHLPPLDAGTAQAVAVLSRDLAAGAPLAPAVAALLGRGPGLTPLGDDVLAGALVALVAAASPAAPRLAAETLRQAPHRTTFVSAALLRHAARGECVPELAAFVAGRPGATEALLRVGHTSGAGLAHGVIAARPAIREASGAGAGSAAKRYPAKRTPAVASRGRTL